MDRPQKEWLLCFDFDGTFIDPEKSHEIDPALQEALLFNKKKNTAIVINTGRSLMEAAAEYTVVDLIFYLIISSHWKEKFMNLISLSGGLI